MYANSKQKKKTTTTTKSNWNQTRCGLRSIISCCAFVRQAAGFDNFTQTFRSPEPYLPLARKFYVRDTERIGRASIDNKIESSLDECKYI